MILAGAIATGNPFPGLRPYEAQEEHLFFGRAVQVDELLGRLGRTRFLAIVGTSGSGKSSLVRAGMLPALNGGLLAKAGSRWRSVVLRPGSEPIANLARAVASLTKSHDTESRGDNDRELRVGLMQAVLARGALGLVEAVTEARLEPDENVLIVVDQFEELFRFTGGSSESERAEEAAAFVKLLLAGATHPAQSIYVALTMRSDFLGECSQFRDLPEMINDGLFLVPRLTRAQLRSTVEGPVGVAGGQIAPRLVTRLLNDLGDDPDQLPVLQHALMRTWNIWDNDHAPGEPIDLRHYEATGGLSRALSLHADEIYAALANERCREVAEKLFQALTEQGSDKRGIRRPERFGEACAIVGCSTEELCDVVNAFRAPDVCFLMPAAGSPLEDDTYLDLSHESLMRVWTRLRAWVEEEAQSAQIYRRVADSAALHAQGEAAYLRDPELSLGLRWRDETKPNATWARRYAPSFDAAMRFLEASAQARATEEAERAGARRAQVRRLRGSVAFLGLALLAMIVVAIVADRSQRTARAAQARAVTSETEARRERSLALMSEAQASDEARRNGLLVRSQEADLRLKQILLQDKQFALKRAVDADREAQRSLIAARRQKRIADEQTRRANHEKSEADRARDTADRATKKALSEANENAAAADFYRGYASNDNDRAIAEYTRAIARNPVLIPAYVQRGLAYERKAEDERARDSYDRAIDDLNVAITNQPWNAQALLSRGALFRKKLNKARAIADVDRAIEIDPKDASAYEQLTSIYIDEEDNEGAIADFDRQIERHPEYVSPYQQLTVFYKRISDGSRGVTDFTQMIERRPGYAAAYAERAYAYERQRKPALALADFGQAIHLDPRDPKLYLGRAYEEDRERRYDLAIADANQAVALEPANGLTYVQRGVFHSDAGAYDLAIEDFTTAAEHDVTGAYAKRAAVYLQKGDFDHAIDDYGRLLQLSPNAANYISRGDAYVRNGNYEAALADYQRAIDLGAANAYIHRAALHGGRGEYDQAIADYGKMIDVLPDDFRPRRDRGITYFSLGRYAAAKSDLDAASERDNSDTYLALWRQLVRFKEGVPDTGVLATEAPGLTRNAALDPIVGMFVGSATFEDALTAARNGTVVDSARMCIASFFVGEYLVWKRDARGRNYLTDATNLCWKNQLEYAAARAELSRLPTSK